MSLPTTSWLLWQNEHRKASSDPARFTQLSPLPPRLRRCRLVPGTPGGAKTSHPMLFLLSPEAALLAMKVVLLSQVSGSLARLFEQESERFLSLNMVGDTP